MQYKVFWCKLNKYYAEEWLKTSFFQDKKGIFLLSCVVTDKAKKKWVKFILDNIKNLKKDEKIYISWCWSIDKWEKLTNFFDIYKELEKYKDKIEILPEKPEVKMKEDKKLQINKLTNLRKILSWIYTKKFILIQSWCDSYCTYCLTVQKRWKHYFREKDEIILDILNYEKSSWKEIVLTWINIWAWWLNSTNEKKERKLSILLEDILKETNIKRIRISSLWVEFVDDKLLKIFENKRIYPHFHYSIQSWSNRILKLMWRHYSWEDVKKLLKKTREIIREDWVSVSIWADIIVGFPWETKEDFLESCNLVSDFQITKLHAFSFSAHKYGETVPASKFLNQIDEKTKKERYNKITQIWEKVRNDFIKSQNWKEFEVLIESVKNDKFKGWTQNYIEVTNDNFEVLGWVIKRNEIVKGELRWLK